MYISKKIVSVTLRIPTAYLSLMRSGEGQEKVGLG